MRKIRLTHFLAITATAALLAACADSPTVTGPQIKPPGLTSLSVNFQAAPPGYKLGTHSVSWTASHGNSEYSVSGLITAAGGGTITVPGADFQITFPAGAVSQDLTVTIVALGGPSVAYDFFPHGIQFSKPVVVTQGLANTSFGALSGVFPALYAAYLPDGYETISSTNAARALEIEASTTLLGLTGSPSSLVFYVNHFSRYILASGDTSTQPDGTTTGS